MQPTIWQTLVPFSCVMLVVAILACGAFWKSVAAVTSVGCFSIFVAIVLVFWYVGLEEWLNAVVYVGFMVLYAFATVSFVKHLDRERDRIIDYEVVPHWYGDPDVE